DRRDGCRADPRGGRGIQAAAPVGRLAGLRPGGRVSGYEQLDIFELTEKVCDTAKRITEGEVLNAEDKLDLAEQMYEARRRMPGNREYGAWWAATDIKYSL